MRQQRRSLFKPCRGGFRRWLQSKPGQNHDPKGRQRWRKVPGLRAASPASEVSAWADPTACCKGPAKVFRLHLFYLKAQRLKRPLRNCSFGSSSAPSGESKCGAAPKRTAPTSPGQLSSAPRLSPGPSSQTAALMQSLCTSGSQRLCTFTWEQRDCTSAWAGLQLPSQRWCWLILQVTSPCFMVLCSQEHPDSPNKLTEAEGRPAAAQVLSFHLLQCRHCTARGTAGASLLPHRT